MSNIKTKDNKPKSVKKLDKAKAWTERIKDPVVYANKKTDKIVNNDESVNDYGADKIKYMTNRTKDEVIYANKKVANATKNQIRKIHSKGKIRKEERRVEELSKELSKDVSNVANNGKIAIKTASNELKTTEKITENDVKLSKRFLEQGKKLAINSSKKAASGTKKLFKGGVSAIKGIMAGLKSLITILAASGSLVFIIVLVFSLACLIVGSVFGIFLSSENLENSIKMSDCIAELNNEMDNKINLLEKNGIYDEVIINSNKTSWKDVLSIYAVRVSDGDTEKDVITMDKEKKAILKEVFWDMNSISHNTVIEEFESEVLGTLDSLDLTDIRNHTLPSYNNPNTETNEKRVLHININSKTINEIMNKYNFTEKQRQQYLELTSEENEKLWYGVIYGNYSSSGEIEDWKQAGKEWANIKIGTTKKTIGNIGCLTTSIAILIKKSDVPTKNIYPFNPGTFVIALNNNYGFDKSGNLLYGAINKAVPNFKYVGTVELSGKSKSQKLYEIKKYAENGYFLAVEVKGATKNSQHWVALDSVSNSNVLMLDPSSNEKDMWNKYNWKKTSQFIYFKASR